MRLAAVDMGTNSSRLLIVDYIDGDFKILKRRLITTRLGEGVDQTGLLSRDAISRAIRAIKQFKMEIETIGGVKKLEMVGTSALRDVTNAGKLVKLIAEETGYELEIVNGQEEARLTYGGVLLDFPGQKILIIDIGGGSTEFIWDRKGKGCCKSLDIGAVRMTERFISDFKRPLSKLDYENLSTEVYRLLKKWLDNSFDNRPAVGVGGTITTLAAMDLKLEKYDRTKIHSYVLKYKQVNKLLERLSGLGINARKKLTGLQPERADVIVAGTIILEQIMKFIGLKQIIVSEYDILFGIIREGIIS